MPSAPRIEPMPSTVSTRTDSARQIAIVSHAPNLFSHTRATPTGPHSARVVQRTAATPSQSQRAERPSVACATSSATKLIAHSSTAVHPTSCKTFRADGTHEPLIPRIGRNRTIVGTPWSAPAVATRARNATPIREPRAIAARAEPNPRAGTRYAPVTSTSRPIPRSPHRTAQSSADSMRCSRGTGRIPGSGSASTRSAIVLTVPPSAGTNLIRW